MARASGSLADLLSIALKRLTSREGLVKVVDVEVSNFFQHVSRTRPRRSE